MKSAWTIAAISSLMVLLSSCEVIGGIFKAGMGFGIFIVVLIVAVIGWLIFKARKNE
jgi:hypothetical protein